MKYFYILREYIGIRRRGLIAQKPHAWAIARMRVTGKRKGPW